MPKKPNQLSIRVHENERTMIDICAIALRIRKDDFIEIAAEKLLDRIESGKPLRNYLLPEKYETSGESKMMTVNLDPALRKRIDRIATRLHSRRTSFLLWAAALEAARLNRKPKKKKS